MQVLLLRLKSMPRNYTKGTPAFVVIKHGEGTNVKYGFKCRLQKEGNYLELGITKSPTIDAAFLQDFVLGCNSPKPNRATKRETTDTHGYESSFISTANIADAKKKGWKIARSKVPQAPSNTTLSHTCYVTLNGIKYAWQAAKVPAGVTVAYDAIGVKIVAAGAKESGLIWGATFPKPPRAEIEIKIGESISNFSTFADPAKFPLPAGWYPAKGKPLPAYTLDALQAIFG